MSEEIKLYIVVGKTGEYDYYEEWIVCGSSNEGKVKDYCGKLNKALDKLNITKSINDYCRDFDPSSDKIDANDIIDPYLKDNRIYFGVEYSIEEIDLI